MSTVDPSPQTSACSLLQNLSVVSPPMPLSSAHEMHCPDTQSLSLRQACPPAAKPSPSWTHVLRARSQPKVPNPRVLATSQLESAAQASHSTPGGTQTLVSTPTTSSCAGMAGRMQMHPPKSHGPVPNAPPGSLKATPNLVASKMEHNGEAVVTEPVKEIATL